MAAIIAVAIKIVGILLIVALLVIPAATAESGFVLSVTWAWSVSSECPCESDQA